MRQKEQLKFMYDSDTEQRHSKQAKFIAFDKFVLVVRCMKVITRKQRRIGKSFFEFSEKVLTPIPPHDCQKHTALSFHNVYVCVV